MYVSPAWVRIRVLPKRAEALQTMDEETVKFARVVFFVTPETADFYAAAGDSSKAIDWIRQAVRNGDEHTDWFRKNPRLASIQKDERFLACASSNPSKHGASVRIN